MPDREKVIKEFEEICGYTMRPHEFRVLNDVLTLLKEQEAVTVHDPGAYCPKCGWMLYPEDHPHNCGNCGQAVKWE